jgi:hypothetical protein
MWTRKSEKTKFFFRFEAYTCGINYGIVDDAYVLSYIVPTIKISIDPSIYVIG